jgi:hypothetical protein
MMRLFAHIQKGKHVKKRIWGILYSYQFDFYSPFSLEKSLEILADYGTWTPYTSPIQEFLHPRGMRKTYHIITKQEGDNLYQFEIQTYHGLNCSPIEVMGIIHQKNKDVHVVGHSKINTMITRMLIIFTFFGCVLLSSPLNFVGVFVLLYVVISIGSVMIECYRIGQYPEKWLSTSRHNIR